MNLTGAMNITAGDEKDNTDEVLLAALAEEIKKMKTVSFQTWYVADENWDDSDHSKVILKGAQIKKQTNAPAVNEPVSYEGKVTEDKVAGNYKLSFDEKLGGGKIVLDIEVKDTTLANGCLDTNVEIDGKPYWVHYSWEAKKSGKVEVDLTEPAGVLDTSVEDGEDSTDEKLLAAAVEIIKNQKSLTFQTWYVADENWDDSDHSKVTLKSATLVKESSAESGDTPVTTPPAVTTPAPETTEPSEPGEFIIGDVDGNGRVDVTDLTFLSLNLIGEHDLSGDNEKAADVDKDGKITLADLARMRQFLSRIIEKF